MTPSNKKCDHFIGNIDRDRTMKVIQAAALSGLNVWVEDNATAQDGQELPFLVAIYTNEEGDMSPFWDALKELQK